MGNTPKDSGICLQIDLQIDLRKLISQKLTQPSKNRALSR